jgi:glycosyltransferase involved in cell wall biosynthesis
MSGSVHAALHVCKQLVARGVHVTIIGTAEPEDDLSHLRGQFAGVPAITFRRSFPDHYSNSATLLKWLRREIAAFDIVDVNGVFSFPVLYAALLSRRHRIPCIVRPHGSLDPFDLTKHATLKRVFGRAVVRRVLTSASAILTTSQQESERLVTFGAELRKTVAIPLPVQRQSFRADTGVTFRRARGIPDDAFVVLFLSRVDYKKGLEFLIPSLAAVKRVVPKLWFLLVGSGEPKFTKGVSHSIDLHGMRGWTTETGFLSGPEKAGALMAADMFALPSLNENFGIAVVEAMQAGLPLLISNQVYIHREVEAAGAGVVCEPTTVDCERALRSMATAEMNLAAMSESAVALTEGEFSPDVATDRLLRLYHDVSVTSNRGAA